MTGAPFVRRRDACVDALILVSVVMVGIALPLGFLSQVDGYLKYLRLVELAAVYAWGWIIFASMGLVLGLIAISSIACAAWLVRGSLDDWIRWVSTWLSLAIVSIALLKATKLWLEVNGFALAAWMAQTKWALASAIVATCAIAAWYRPALPWGLRGIAKFGAFAGLVPAAVAILAGAFTPHAAPVPLTRAAAMGHQPQRPNVLLITIDTLSADHVSFYGYTRETTPSLDRLARQSTVFSRFYASSNHTTSSINSIIHGVRPWSHRAVQSSAMIDADIADRNLVRKLREVGYQTIAVATNEKAAPSHIRVTPWLDKVAEGRLNLLFPQSIAVTLPPLARHSLGMGVLPAIVDAIEQLSASLGVDFGAHHFDPELAISTARDLLARRDPRKLFFLWLHLYPPHAPYATPLPFVGRFDPGPDARTRFDSTPPPLFMARRDMSFPGRYVGRYDESILYVDHHIGRFVDWLKREQLFDDSLIVVTSDHGESFVNDYGLHGGPMLHDALVRVPLIVKEPGQRVGRRINVLAEHIDLMPTIFDLVGIPPIDAGEGRSLQPAMRGETMAGAVFSMNFEQSDRFGDLHTGSVAMIEGQWKYVHYRGQLNYPLQPKLMDSLYELDVDPQEKVNLVAERINVAATMRNAIDALLLEKGGPAK